MRTIRFGLTSNSAATCLTQAIQGSLDEEERQVGWCVWGASTTGRGTCWSCTHHSLIIPPVVTRQNFATTSTAALLCLIIRSFDACLGIALAVLLVHTYKHTYTLPAHHFPAAHTSSDRLPATTQIVAFIVERQRDQLIAACLILVTLLLNAWLLVRRQHILRWERWARIQEALVAFQRNVIAAR